MPAPSPIPVVVVQSDRVYLRHMSPSLFANIIARQIDAIRWAPTVPANPESRMISRRLRLAFCVCTALVALFSPIAQAQGWQESSITVGGVERWYRVYVPDALPRGSRVYCKSPR